MSAWLSISEARIVVAFGSEFESNAGSGAGAGCDMIRKFWHNDGVLSREEGLDCKGKSDEA